MFIDEIIKTLFYVCGVVLISKLNDKNNKKYECHYYKQHTEMIIEMSAENIDMHLFVIVAAIIISSNI